MDGPRNNLDEIKRKNYLQANQALRSESKKTKAEGYKFKIGASDASESIYPSIIPKPRKIQNYIPTANSLHTQHAVKPSLIPGPSTPARKITPSSIPQKRPSPDALASSSKRLRKETPLSTSTRSNLPPQSRQNVVAETSTTTKTAPVPKPSRELTVSPQKFPEMPTPSALTASKGSKLNSMSMDRLVKLKSSRQQKTINHADLLIRLKAKEEDEGDDIELMEAQYALLKNSIKEIENVISQRRALENPSSSSSFSSPSAVVAPVNLHPPSFVTTVKSPVRNARVTIQTFESRTETISTDATLSEPTSSLDAPSTLRSSNGRVPDESDEAEDEDKLWDEIGDLEDVPLPREPHSPQTGRQVASKTVVEIKTTRQTTVSPTKFPRASQVPVPDYSGDSLYEEAKRVLRNTFKKEKFRHNQAEAIMGTLQGRDVFVLMPTGGGKSMCYQVPAVCTGGKTRGVSVIISPLISLMKDQVDELNRLGVDVAVLNSDQSHEDRRETLSRLGGRGVKPALLYMSPELIEKGEAIGDILKRLHGKKEIARFVVDESHCLSQWGRNFRRSYLNLRNIRLNYPDVPIMALTATATDQVAQDIINVLMMKDCLRFQQSFNRPNLTYSVVRKAKDVVGNMANWIEDKHPGETGVIYCLSQRDCETVAEALSKKHGIKAAFYHAKMDTATKRETQSEWQKGKIQVIVATIAFGMGIDKADVRFVIHHAIPKSLEGLYQETGRAGRDGEPADCVLYYAWKDVQRLDRMFERSLQEGEITPAECARQQDDVRAVASYCELDIDCRREQVLRYFGQSFDRSECNEGCDNCASGRSGTLQDFTKEAIQIVKLVDEAGGKLTQIQITAIYMGSNKKEIRDRGFNQSSFYGKGQHLSPRVIERIIPMMLIKGYLTETIVKNNHDHWHSTYVQVGNASSKLLDGKEKFSIMISDSQSAGKGKKDKGKQRVATVKSVNRTKRMEISYFENDDDDLGRPIEEYSRAPVADSDEECAPPQPKAKPARRLVETIQKSEVITIDDDDDDSGQEFEVAHDPFHKKLIALRRQIAREKGKAEPLILSDECLEILALMIPPDISQFQVVLRDAYRDTAKVEDVMKRWGMRFLSLCVAEAAARETANKPKGITSNPPPKNPPRAPSVRKEQLRSKYTFVPANHRPGKVPLVEGTLVASTSRRGGIRGMDI